MDRHSHAVIYRHFHILPSTPAVITSIEHDLSGCFGSSHSLLTIYKNQDTIYARLETDGKTKQLSQPFHRHN